VKVSVIVPVKNEADNLSEFLPLVRPHGDQLIVVDGHSSDGSAEIARRHADLVLLDGGAGKGDGLRTGVSAAAHDLVVFIDADFSHDPADIPRLVAPLRDGSADHVQGSRMLGGSDELFTDFANYVRLFGSLLITAAINLRFGSRITDSQNGLRAMRKSVFEALGTVENSTTIEQEMIMKTLARGFKLHEVATHEYPRRAGVSKVSLRRVWARYIWHWLTCLFTA
jgi:glycosyltransferase involved in cell wall biosynthesis